MISNFRRVLDVVCFLLGYSPASEFYVPTFRNRQCCALSGIIGTYKLEQSYLFIYKRLSKQNIILISHSITNYVNLYINS